MIASDRHRFVFIHIPKCAGSYARRTLAAFDDIQHEFSGGVHQHPVLGEIDHYHLPLITLRDHFPAVFQRVSSYSSFALLRNPFERFPSSVAQRVKQYRALPMHRISPAELTREVESVIRHLACDENSLDPGFAHFCRQSAYVELDDMPVVNYLFAVADVNAMLLQIGELVGRDLEIREGAPVVNRADVYRNESLRKLFEALRPLVAGAPIRLLPQSLQGRIRRAIYTPATERTPAIFRSAGVTDFIREHYRRDIQLFDRVKAGGDNRGKSSGAS